MPGGESFRASQMKREQAQKHVKKTQLTGANPGTPVPLQDAEC